MRDSEARMRIAFLEGQVNALDKRLTRMAEMLASAFVFSKLTQRPDSLDEPLPGGGTE